MENPPEPKQTANLAPTESIQEAHLAPVLFGVPLWDKITVAGVIGTLLSVIASAIAGAFALGS